MLFVHTVSLKNHQILGVFPPFHIDYRCNTSLISPSDEAILFDSQQPQSLPSLPNDTKKDAKDDAKIGSDQRAGTRAVEDTPYEESKHERDDDNNATNISSKKDQPKKKNVDFFFVEDKTVVLPNGEKVALFATPKTVENVRNTLR